MDTVDEVMMFAAFVANSADPLFVFSDAVVHASCFISHPLSRDARKWHDEVLLRMKASNRICVVCKTAILDPDDYFGTGLLSRDPGANLFEFNFVHLHRNHAEQWSRFLEFSACMDAAQASGQWRGPTLERGPSPSKTMRWVFRRLD